ncbi:clathrin light chain [Gilbertella persicaria]|uniref:clathrin light chain n=1 Tax=Gilbertella persicaria TaxID=101096 RepID=UPI0022206E90|nr:clathrin light chain [Gilbertella persicaria]KAI8092300.1 clathrin light chain [Gilbertella persicaria]
MSDFGDFNTPSEDPTADFLARERAALGQDADFFTNDDSLISSSHDLTSPPLPTSLPMSPAIFNDSPQLGHETAVGFLAENTLTSFETSYPKAEELESSQAFHKALMPEEEPETVRQWREKQAEIIAQRDAESEAKKEEKIKHAREDIDKFYEDYNDKKQKAIEENREREENYKQNNEQVASSANIWDRVVKEIDISNAKTGYHTKDVIKMKELMLDLKRDPKAPGNMIEA